MGSPPPAVGQAPAASNRAAAPPAVGSPAGSTTGTPAKGVSLGRRARSLQQVEGIVTDPEGVPRVATAQYDAGLGKYLSPEDSTKELVGFVPHKSAASVITTLGKAQATNAQIDAALEALTPYKNDHTLAGAVKMSEGYKHGTEADPVALAASSLSDLAGLQTSGAPALTQGSPRTKGYFVARMQHVPRLPSGRQDTFSHIPGLGATGVERLSEIRKGDEGGFDSPAQMYEKLQLAKKNNQLFVDEVKKSLLGGNPMPKDDGKPGAAAAPAGGIKVIYARDPQGNLHQAAAGTKLPAGWVTSAGPQ